MVADVILGINVDTNNWIENLKLNSSEHIVVIDYDYFGEQKKVNGIIFISSFEAIKYFEKFDSVCFYKSLYIYPGMSGKMTL